MALNGGVGKVTQQGYVDEGVVWESLAHERDVGNVVQSEGAPVFFCLAQQHQGTEEEEEEVMYNR